MKRRTFFGIVWIPATLLPVWGDENKPTFIRGLLIQQDESSVRLKIAGNRMIALSGDEPTQGVLTDPRLKDFDFEVGGKFTTPAQNQFEIDPIHTRSLFVHQDGKKLMVTYWCDICYIRTFTPGVCWCCQDWTRLDLKDPDTPDPKP